MRERRSLPQRVAACESTIARFAGKPFAWQSQDCVRLVAHALRELTGEAPPLRQLGRYTTHLGGRRAIRRTGHATLHAWVDTWGLVRIPPAAALPADIVALPSGDDAMPSLALVVSAARVLAFVPELGVAACVALAPGVTPLVAWSA